MSIIIQTADGKVVVDEVSGRVLDQQALRSEARALALASGLDPDAVEFQIQSTTGFDPGSMGNDPLSFIVNVASGGSQPNPSPSSLEDNSGDTPVTPPASDPTNPLYWRSIGEAPPWTKAGFSDYTSWAANQRLQQEQQDAKDAAQLELLRAQVGNTGASTSQSAANSAASLAQQAALQKAQLAEERRQFDEKFGMDKAINDQTRAYQQQQLQADAAQLAQQGRQFDATLANNKANTLLGLGSRPETLVRYLYALRGQQAPQGLGRTGPALPGAAQTAVGTAQQVPSPTSGTGGILSLAEAPPGSPAYLAQVEKAKQAQPVVQPPQSFVGSGVTNASTLLPSLQDPATRARLIAEAQGGGTNRTTTMTENVPSQIQPPRTLPQQLPASYVGSGVNDASALLPGLQDPSVRARLIAQAGGSYGEGGLIPERVVGVGQDSGQTYEFGEKGTEAVVSNDMLERLMQVAGKVDLHHRGRDGGSHRFTFTLNEPPKPSKDKADNSYASGGAIGYDPRNVPTLGSQSSGLFNDPNLQNVVQRGYNSTPDVPFFPQVGIATGGGQSLIPSQQRLNSLLPSEQQAFAGSLNDEFGVQSDDVFALARKLAPQVSGLQTPRFTN